MKTLFRSWLILLWASLSLHTAHAAESELVDTGFVNAQLVSSHDVVAPGQSFHMALRTVLDPKWHTYWYNPGDSGEPVQITWMVPDTLSPGEIIWPLPEPIATGPIINYGFEGIPYFPVEFKVSQDALPGEQILVTADVYYLVCSDICVPEGTMLSLQIGVGDPVVHDRWNDAINVALKDAPKAGPITGGAKKVDGQASYTFQNLPDGVDVSSLYFFPYENDIIDHSAPQLVTQGDNGIRLTTPAAFGWDNGTPDNLSGVLGYDIDGQKTGQIVEVARDMALPIGAMANTPGTAQPAASSMGLIGAIIAAFIGGLILNLMPCVFPIISMKALSVAKTAHTERAHVKREGWVYTAGVVATFLVLTLILLAVKAGGAEVGWGFQLQSPQLVAALALLLFVIGLNLLGVFEIGTRLQGAGSELTTKDGWLGTFFTGALAVIVATPCTAPFMAGAVGYALAQPALITIAVFMALAFGFAAPFLLLAYSPGLLTKLPKPGPWMVRFREILAFPMFAAAIWLVWVLNMQAGADGLLAILSAMLLFALAVWLFKRRPTWAKALGVAALLAALALPLTTRTASTTTQLEMQAWSPERVAELRANGQTVFVDFTAAWCVTCKVNEKLVLSRPDVKQVFEETNTAFVIADWTNKNDAIAQELARHGRSGIPLYLVYPPGNNPVSPEILPQVLTKTVIEDAIKRASAL